MQPYNPDKPIVQTPDGPAVVMEKTRDRVRVKFESGTQQWYAITDCGDIKK